MRGALGRLIGRTKGGLNTRLHAVNDANGRPLSFARQPCRAEIASGPDLRRGRSPLRFTKMISLSTRRSSTWGLPWLFGKYGSSRATYSFVSQYGSLKIQSRHRA